MIYLTAIELPPGGSSTVHIYTQTVHRTTQFTNQEECGPCSVFARYNVARQNLSQGSRKMPVGLVKTKYTEQSIKTIRIHKHNNKKHKHNNKIHISRIAALPNHKSAALKYGIIPARSVSWKLRFRGGNIMV